MQTWSIIDLLTVNTELTVFVAYHVQSGTDPFERELGSGSLLPLWNVSSDQVRGEREENLTGRTLACSLGTYIAISLKSVRA